LRCNSFQPGWRVTSSGVYRVHHFQHRVSHLVSIYRGETFPECLTCKHLVRFEEVLTLVELPAANKLKERLRNRAEEMTSAGE
jgi:hypothetical protein